MSAAPVTRSKKAIIEKERREVINAKVDVLRDLITDPSVTKKMSIGEVLNRAALLLNGQDASVPISPALSSSGSDSAASSPGPIRSRREVRKNREQGRRDLQVAGFDALQKFVIDNGLSTDARLERTVLLDIIIEQVKKVQSAASAASLVSPALTPSTPTAPATIQPAPIVVPVPAVPVPAVPLFNFLTPAQIYCLYYAYFLSMQKIEYIDIIN